MLLTVQSGDFIFKVFRLSFLSALLTNRPVSLKCVLWASSWQLKIEPYPKQSTHWHVEQIGANWQRTEEGRRGRGVEREGGGGRKRGEEREGGGERKGREKGEGREGGNRERGIINRQYFENQVAYWTSTRSTHIPHPPTSGDRNRKLYSRSQQWKAKRDALGCLCLARTPTTVA